MAKSATQEMAAEIARIAQTQVVEADRVSFACGPVTLKMVKTTLGPGWVLNDNVLFLDPDFEQLVQGRFRRLGVRVQLVEADALLEVHPLPVGLGKLWAYPNLVGAGTVVALFVGSPGAKAVEMRCEKDGK